MKGQRTTLDQLTRLARGEVDRVRAELPEQLRQPTESLLVSYAWQPEPGMIEDGIEPDTLGLFEGDDYAYQAQPTTERPTRIILYLYNLWQFARADLKTFLDEVRTTYLHEMGHYLGLDEDDIAERGLE
ncbi:MAG: metallopeptidase family protein [Verrucomicrobiota bacterium]